MQQDYLDRLIDLSLDEDLGAAGDVTSLALVPADAEGSGELLAKEQLVLAGLEAFTRVFHKVDPRVEVEVLRRDGEEIKPKVVAARVHGRLRSLLAAERTALNLVQRAAGIATLAQQAMTSVRGSKLLVLDTRKTPPGMRGLAKEAVRLGGATNHRFGLFDGILIKDNHIAAVGGSVTEAVRRAKAHGPRLVKIEIEVTTLKQLAEAIEAGADVVMLDNMDDAQIREAVKLAGGRVPLEVSGGVTLDRLPRLAKMGVDFVSMGALTHSARAMDLSLEISGAKKAVRKPRAAASQG
ncbi:carboxylating nicotinate-nucleotide diphosphorylase [Corallococcus sp. H22C18031201]|uniref:carboxylating nicotinate-nucleotide diphosphorylase n=1 Tax=Citreicoccus inhibens TaxID=2849499 RepID=UPI000E75BAD7|nr:carboxylating nicotinate-nucleotide diphosphorylase [Citreicoccus inhibens]MBU8897862.1 carboxylating nicotinate-nucleotide diphosphorylase [Citreicoccus inhibens]RJS24876.1 carboxylating nicotinate-nucleotide diphosphorylase [Corallococcus sp. H22C18031201]